LCDILLAFAGVYPVTAFNFVRRENKEVKVTARVEKKGASARKTDTLAKPQ
jgi:hypothetical protein